MLPMPRDRLIKGTIELIAANGVAGTGISELILRSAVSRRTLYVNFPGGKSELVTDATKSAGRSMTDVLIGMVSDAPVQAALPAFGSWWAETLRESAFSRGCPIVAAALGRSGAPAAAEAARTTFAGWVEVLQARLEMDGVNRIESRGLAVTIVAAVEGAVVLCLAEESVEPLDQAIAQMTRLVALLSGPDSA